LKGALIPFFSKKMMIFLTGFSGIFLSPKKRQYVKNSLGSGVIIDSAHKYILTNHHVIVRASKIAITLANQQEF